MGKLTKIISTKYLTDGAKRIRTADFLNAIETLYQLSYSPVFQFTVYYIPLIKEL